MEFDIATLIHEIKIRKPLWQRRHLNRHRRELVNLLWNEVADIMGVTKDLVKTKWKGLRDNFRSELRKIPENQNFKHQSKWIYFNDMTFIRDEMLSKTPVTSENVNVDVDVYADGYTPGVANTGYNPFAASGDPNSDVERRKRLLASYCMNPAKRYKYSGDDDDDDDGSESNHKLNNDEDFYFLMSFLPVIKKLPTDKRMFLRLKIQNLVYKELSNRDN